MLGRDIAVHTSTLRERVKRNAEELNGNNIAAAHSLTKRNSNEIVNIATSGGNRVWELLGALRSIWTGKEGMVDAIGLLDINLKLESRVPSSPCVPFYFHPLIATSDNIP